MLQIVNVAPIKDLDELSRGLNLTFSEGELALETFNLLKLTVVDFKQPREDLNLVTLPVFEVRWKLLQ